MKVRIGTRGSDLALWQARHVTALFAQCGVECETIIIKTRGDLIDDVPLSKVEGKAFFTAEIERALLAGEVDVAVHSHKDLPTEMTPGLTIAAVPERGPQTERLLIAPAAHDPRGAFLPLRRGARVGTSAPRRLEQLRTLRPDLDVVDLRGNVPTRVRKLREGHYDAIVLAAAGLDRLALDCSGLVAVDLALEVFVPAPAQGALAIQVRSDDEKLLQLCRTRLHHAETAARIEAERVALAAAGGGCSLPLAAAVGVDTSSDAAEPPAPQLGGREPARAGISPARKTWVAHTFLGAGYPATARHARWAVGRGADPRAAIDAALAQLSSGAPTRVGPLAGLRVALTGSASDGSALGERLAALGAETVQERVIEMHDLPGVDLAGAIARLRAGDVLALTSRHAARLAARHSLPASVHVIAVGRACARTYAEGGREVDLVGEGGGAQLAAQLELAAGAQVLWPCAQEPLPEFEAALRARSISVQRLPVYRTEKSGSVELARDVDARVYMSPSAVEAALAWERAHPDSTAQRFALGHATAAALESAHLRATAPGCSNTPITEELVHELVKFHRAGRGRAQAQVHSHTRAQ